MFILGIVGSPAGGKSTVAARLQELGAEWINADLVARSVLDEKPAQQQLISRFGDNILRDDGQIDRVKIASLVFGDDDASREALKYLEGVVHPRTRLLITERLRQCAQPALGADRGAVAAILDVPLLFRSGWDQTCDEIWCVDADREIRMERARDRGWQAGELARREANQMDIEEKKRLSNHVIMNNAGLEELHCVVDQMWASFLRRARDHSETTSPHCP